MTTVTLLPHHHHHGCGEMVCLLPYDCDHDKTCKHEHDSSAKRSSECGFNKLDLSIVSTSEKQMSVPASFVLFFSQIKELIIERVSIEEELFVAKSVPIFVIGRTFPCGLRAPPMYILYV